MKLFNKVIDASKTWITSDWHLNHKNICKSTSSWNSKDGCRDFESLDEMNDVIIDRMNLNIPADHTIINLGDIVFGDKKQLPNFLRRLNCQNHHYILGNHDHWMIGDDGEFKPEVKNVFSSMQFYLEVYARMPNGSKHKICFNHFSGRVWHDSHKGSIMLYGHSHGTIPDYGRSIDVGVDATNGIYPSSFEPYRLQEIIEVVSKREIIKVDHH